MKRAYVAGSIHDRTRVRRAQRILRHRNWKIETDWTQPVFEEMTRWQRAQVCKRAAEMSDLFVLIVPEHRHHGLGCYVEFGLAAASVYDPRIIVVGQGRESDFWHLPGVEWYADVPDLAKAVHRVRD